VHLGQSFKANAQAAKSMRPGDGSFDHSAGLAPAADVLAAARGNQRGAPWGSGAACRVAHPLGKAVLQLPDDIAMRRRDIVPTFWVCGQIVESV